MSSEWNVDEELIESFEESWANNSFSDISKFVPQDVSEDFLGNLFELVVIDLEFRWKRFEPNRDHVSEDEILQYDLAWYLEKWPLLSQVKVHQKLLLEEFTIRRKYGDQPSTDSFIEQMPALADEFTQLAREYPIQESTPESFRSSQFPIVENYKILREIGEGGMGSVFLAQQEQPVRRQVALKVIRTGLNSKEVIARFEAERQALAMMDHQNIARIYEAGTTQSGKPFFAMEYVQGIPLTDYCKQKRLSVSDRLKVFQDVCAAVQHAHQKGILHRDLKPSNVIIAEENAHPLVKVIDFGLAKALDSNEFLTEKTMQTQAGQVLGTLKYMSPEQAALHEQNVDTRADVYALGVILYELLTGGTPLDELLIKEHGVISALELIRDLEPQRPSMKLSLSADISAMISAERNTDSSTLRQVLRGDLDWIVMKALENDRERRYESVHSFADDVRRFLNDEPVLARPPSTSYRVRKFAKKNRVLVTSAMGLLTLLILGFATTTWQAIRASRAEVDADQQKQIAIGNAEVSEKRRLEADALRELETEARQEAVQAVKEMEFQNYIANLNRTHMAMQVGNRDEAEQVLMQCPEALRGLEWNMLYRKVFGQVLTLTGHSNRVWRARFNPRGSMIVSTARILGQPSELFLWDAETGDLLRKFEGHRSWIQTMDFSDDGKLLVTVGGNAMTTGGFGNLDPYDLGSTQSSQPEVLVWDVETGTLLRELGGHGSDFVFSCKFVPDSHQVATATYGLLSLFEADTGESLCHTGFEQYDSNDPLRIDAFDPTGVPHIEFFPDGKRVLVFGRNLFDYADGALERVETLPTPSLTSQGIPNLYRHGGVGVAVFEESFSMLQTKNHELKITAFGVENGFLTSGESRVIAQHRANVTAVDMNANPEYVLSADAAGFVQINSWRVDGLVGQKYYKPIQQHEVLVHQGRVNDVSFRRDGKQFVSCGDDGKIRVWNTAIPQGELKLPSRDQFGSRSIALSSRGDEILDHNGRLFQTSEGTPLTDERHLPLKSFDNLDESILNDPLKVLNTVASERDFQYHNMSMSPNRQLFLHYGHTNWFAEVLHVRSLEQIAIVSQNGNPRAALFLDDERIAAVNMPGQLVIYELKQKKERLLESDSEVNFIAKPMQQNLLFVAQQNQIACLDSENWQQLFKLPMEQPIERMVASPQGNMLAIVVPEKILLWDTNSKLNVGELASPKTLNTLMFNHDGSRLLTLAKDQTLTFWHVSSQLPLLSVRVGDDFASDLQLSEDDRKIAFGSLFSTVINAQPPE